jgi:hypothetical protein
MKPDRREKCVDLGGRRIIKTLKDISLIGNLSNRSNYSYTEQDVKKIVSALRKAVDDMKARFDRKAAAGDSGFKL